ncbi:MAG: hypothetical protein LBV04_09670, partial [Deferribacteraceae bacterium]|nr:hypothetical protein [Deferribacteraceae bacterium]
MRVSFLQQANRYQDNLQTSLTKYINAQDKLIKQREVLNPEDKPTNYTAAYSIQRTLDDMGQFMSNADGALGWLQASEVNIDEAVDITKKAREFAVAGSVGHLTREAAQALGKDTLNLYNRMFELGNAQHMGRFIFSGFDTDEAPFQDRVNSVSSITQYFGRGGDVGTRAVFGDFSELKSGEYTMEVSMQNGRCYMTMIDSYGKRIMVDSNGSDDTLKSGNDMVEASVFEYEPGKVINTGLGVTLTLPRDPAVLFSGLKYTFRYQAGAADSYFGDNGVLYNKIGYNQHVAMNFPGNELFMQNNKILRSGQLTTATGVNATASTRFSELKNANTNIGDSISFRGLDHLGRPLGSATVAGTRSVTYNMEASTEEERTLTFGYAGNFYQIVVPQQSYKDMDELLIHVRRELARAKFAGAQTPMDYMGIEGLEANHFAENTTISPTPFEVDLTKQITVARDGDRLSFTTAA